jgi:allantoin racemase
MSPSTRRVLLSVVNVNTSAEMTEVIRKAAEAAATPGTEIEATQPWFGPTSVEGAYDSFISAAAVLDLLGTLSAETAGVVLAGFGEHGREGARELLEIPVVDITEAAVAVAQLVGARYGIVTTLERCVVQITDSLRSAGVLQRCAAIEATGLAVAEVGDEGALTLDVMERAGRRAIDKGADVLCLGCAGMAGMEHALEDRLGVPVVDGVAAAVQLLESLVRLGLRTSKRGPYAAPLPKPRPGWPITS